MLKNQSFDTNTRYILSMLLRYRYRYKSIARFVSLILVSRSLYLPPSASIRQLIQTFGLIHEYFEPFLVFSAKKKMSAMNEKKSSAEQTISETKIKIFVKNFQIQNFRPKIFSFVNIYEYSEKTKAFQTNYS